MLLLTQLCQVLDSSEVRGSDTAPWIVQQRSKALSNKGFDRALLFYGVVMKLSFE